MKLKNFRDSLTPEQTLLLGLALTNYLFNGLYLGLFTQGIDFDLVYQAAHLVVIHQAPQLYDTLFTFQVGMDPLFFMYPPVVALIYSPLGYLSRDAAFVVFQALSHLFLWATLWVFLKTWCPDKRRWPIAIAVYLLFYPLIYALHMGQSEPIVLWCLVMGLKYFKEDHEVVSSFLLVIAIWLKIFLLPILLYFILIKRYRYTALCAGWLLLGAAWSWHAVTGDVLKQYVMALAHPIGIEAFIDNQSLTGIFYRSLTFNNYTHGFTNASVLAGRLAKAGGLLLLGIFAWNVRIRLSPDELEEGLSYSLITLLLVSPHTDTHHLALLLIPFLFLVAEETWTLSTIFFYAFFAMAVPLWGFKFLSISRGLFWSAPETHLILSIPFAVLLGFWMYYTHRIRRMTP